MGVPYFLLKEVIKMDSTTASKNDSKNNADVLKWLRGLFAKQLDAEKHAGVRIPSSAPWFRSSNGRAEV